MANALTNRPHIDAVASLAGATRTPSPLPLPTRTGGFGGDAGFAHWLETQGVQAVLDATHPFAHRVSRRTARICGEKNLPYLQLLRPPWQPGPEARWIDVAQEADVAAHIPEGSTVFLATGRKTLQSFENLSRNRRLLCRQIDPPEAEFPFKDGDWILGRPPFSVDQEVSLFEHLGVDWLVVKNAGGVASASKLRAAEKLGIPIAMITRPTQPDAPRVASVDEALTWVDHLQ